jgi:hypothetical protein
MEEERKQKLDVGSAGQNLNLNPPDFRTLSDEGSLYLRGILWIRSRGWADAI